MLIFGQQYFIILKSGNLTDLTKMIDFSHSQYSNSLEFNTEFQIGEFERIQTNFTGFELIFKLIKSSVILLNLVLNLAAEYCQFRVRC